MVYKTFNFQFSTFNSLTIALGIGALPVPGVPAHIGEGLFRLPAQDRGTLGGVGVAGGDVAGAAVHDLVGHGHAVGGLKGLDLVVWDVEEVTDSTLVLSYLHEDGAEGMPGNLKIVMTYALTSDNEFKVDYVAETDKTTHVNISHHSFFNLKGEGNGTINDHILYINASNTTPVNAVLIPSGEIADVTGTPFDFRQAKTIGQDLEVENEQIANGGGYDHNWILDRQTPDQMELAASVYEPASGRFMEVYTDQPALQFYGGNFFDGTTEGKYGKALRYRESIALETQKYPDTPNHSNFPSTLLNPGETYTHRCVYRFSVK